MVNIFQRVSKAAKVLMNGYENERNDVSIENKNANNKHSLDLFEATPHKIKRTITNRRFASTHPLVSGILNDIVTKANGVYVLEGDAAAVKHIEEKSKEWKLDNKFDETIWKGLVEGNSYLHKRVVNNSLEFKWLAYDSENFKIIEVYDKNNELIGYKQRIKINTFNNSDWKSASVSSYEDENISYRDVWFDIDEVVAFKYFERDGKGHAPMNNVLDDVYHIKVLEEQMPLSVYKNSNIMIVTVGNENQRTLTLPDDARDQIADIFNDYHKKGSVFVPYGVDVDLLKGGTLPEIENYLKYYQRNIYAGLNTPEAVFSSESSNRATADIQLDSTRSGRVLLFEYIQNWLKLYWEEIFREELELANIKGEVTINFIKDYGVEEEDSDDVEGFTDPNSLHKPIRTKGTEDENREGSTNITKQFKETNKNHDVNNLTKTVERNK